MKPLPANFKIPIIFHSLKLAEFLQPNKHIAAEQPSKFRPPRSRQRKNRFTERASRLARPHTRAHAHSPQTKTTTGFNLQSSFSHRSRRTSGQTLLSPDARHSRTRSDTGFEHFGPLLTGKNCDFRTWQLQFDGQSKKTSVWSWSWNCLFVCVWARSVCFLLSFLFAHSLLARWRVLSCFLSRCLVRGPAEGCPSTEVMPDGMASRKLNSKQNNAKSLQS